MQGAEIEDKESVLKYISKFKIYYSIENVYIAIENICLRI